MKVAYKSDLGRKRKNNEDAIRVDESKGIFLLADGMGGHQAGEVASDLAVNEAYAYLKDGVNLTKDEKDVRKLLVEALLKAHDAIREKSKTDLNLRGMGTTLVELVIKDDKAYICHVGDSRVYLLRICDECKKKEPNIEVSEEKEEKGFLGWGKKKKPKKQKGKEAAFEEGKEADEETVIEGIKQITKDQTIGNYLVECNIMKREEVPPQKWHTLTQAVGVSENIVPELNHIELNTKDLLLLCSDGLTDMLTDEEIKEVIQRYRDDLDKMTDALVEAANSKGGRDNISVVLIEI